ncbi:hypothetical protein C8Q76DRAFT_129415 [Earliella scabrosa]|nr:hypothetical protein C8Q76DRAFT_129415 [Earliella scabrosa]
MKRLEGSLGRRCMASELQIVVLVLSSDAGRSQTMCEGGVGFFRLQCSVGARPSATGRGHHCAFIAELDMSPICRGRACQVCVSGWRTDSVPCRMWQRLPLGRRRCHLGQFALGLTFSCDGDGDGAVVLTVSRAQSPRCACCPSSAVLSDLGMRGPECNVARSGTSSGGRVQVQVQL